MKKRTRKKQNKKTTPAQPVSFAQPVQPVQTIIPSEPSSGKKGKWFPLIVVLAGLVLLAEVVSVLKTQTMPRNFWVQTALEFTGDDQPCKIFGAWDMALVNNQRIAVSDQGQGRILIFDRQGKFIQGITQKQAGPPPFHELSGMTSDSKGNIYVMDCWNGLIRGFDLNGRPNLKIRIQDSYGPRGLAWFNGNFYVADTGTHRVLKIASDGTRLASWGVRGKEKGMMDGPRALSLDASGNIYVVDTGNRRVDCFDPAGKFIRSYETGSEPICAVVDSVRNLVYVSTLDFLKVFSMDGKFLGDLTDVKKKESPIRNLGGLKVTPEGDLFASHDTGIAVFHPSPPPVQK